MTHTSKEIVEALLKSKELNHAWTKELADHGVSDKSKALQAKLYEFNKKHFPVTILCREGVDLLSREKYSYGEIDFSKISGWADREPFFTVKKGMYDPNEISKTIGLTYSRGGGSAYYNFNYTEVNVKILEGVLEKHGYIVEVKGKEIQPAIQEELDYIKGKLIENPVYSNEAYATLELALKDENGKTHRVMFFKAAADKVNAREFRKGDLIAAVGTYAELETFSDKGKIVVAGWYGKWMKGVNVRLYERGKAIKTADISVNQVHR